MPGSSRGTTLLSPFDSLLWYRDRVTRLFGFDYRIEVYTPGHKRVHGYYTLPILHHGHLIGRVDAKSHRAERRLEVRHVHLERWLATTGAPPSGQDRMDPDEAIAAGWLKPESPTAKLLGGLLKSSLQRAEKIVVLDRFVKERLRAKGVPEEKIDVIPPWAHDDSVRFDAEGREAFRRAHDLAGKFVVMYAGNHSPCHPLDTVLAAARQLRKRDDIVFVFAGGGSEQQKVREFAHRNQLANVLCLPYEPIEKLSALLSAADLHLVVMGERFRGIVHPSKIYNLLAIGSPFLYIGPAESHLGEIIERPGDSNSAFHARPGEVDLVSQVIRGRVDQHPAINPLATPTSRGSVTAPLAQEFSKAVLLPRLLAQVEALCTRAPEAETEPPATKLQSAVR